MDDLHYARSVLPDDAPVIRGGLMEIRSLLDAADKARKNPKLRRPGISVYADDCPLADLAAVLMAGSMHRSGCLSTVARIRDAGFEMEQTFKWPHHTIWVPDHDTEEWLKRLVSVFDDPVKLDAMEGGGEQ